MANSSAGRTAKNKAKTPALTWHELARPTAQKRARWERSENRTRWVACGILWEAVSIAPMETGLAALVAMRAETHRGYPVLADHLRDDLYVMVAAGSGSACADVPGVRVLSEGHQLLVPSTEFDGTAVADWVSSPCEQPPAFVAADRLTAHLQELTRPQHERAATS
ncbi:hypothetical protein ACFWPU_44585 [Streptomyces sp. NPDC058471]|uniref:hypothetical protein n=1 Tax=Streptomyces sp. NPDC058471 TaxID=3346516 RepID=UPI0036649D5D